MRAIKLIFIGDELPRRAAVTRLEQQVYRVAQLGFSSDLNEILDRADDGCPELTLRANEIKARVIHGVGVFFENELESSDFVDNEQKYAIGTLWEYARDKSFEEYIIAIQRSWEYAKKSSTCSSIIIDGRTTTVFELVVFGELHDAEDLEHPRFWDNDERRVLWQAYALGLLDSFGVQGSWSCDFG